LIRSGKEKEEQLQAELVNTKLETARANERAEQIKKELSWRRLSEEQFKKIIAKLKPFSTTFSAFAERIPNQMGLDWNTNGPAGKNWVKATDIHYLNKKSIKKVKALSIMQDFVNT